MKDTTLKIALAGLMHDIGKFAQGCLPVTKEYMASNAALYQPFRDGRHTHVHAVYTAAFIEQMADSLPDRCNGPGWGHGDPFINLAAGHHNPETPMQWIVTMADRISSGLDRATFEKGEKIAYQHFKKTRLLPIFEALGPHRNREFTFSEKFRYEYSLQPVSASSIFPVKRKALDKSAAQKEYNELFQGFVDALPGLYHRDLDEELWSQHFDSLLMVYASAIPAARVGDVVHDVSLYDHCRTTAAIAAGLYQYHAGRDTLGIGAIQDNAPEKFLLIGGDFYGIQEFIFSMHGESGKFRSKLLRGRSFAVSLFSELAARLVCQRLGLPTLSVLINAAGKFHILAPNLDETVQALKESKEEINDWLFRHTYGESSMGISWTPVSPAHFRAGAFRKLWEKHLRNVEASKYRKIDLCRHGGAVKGYLDSFNNEMEAGKRLCPLCGKRPSAMETLGDVVFRPDDTVSCVLCRDHIYLGGNLVKGKMVAVCTADAFRTGRQGLMEPVFGRYQVGFKSDSADDLAEQKQLLAMWHTGVNEDGSVPSRATAKLINGHVPWFRKEDNYDDCLLESAKSQGKLDEMISQINEEAVKTFGHIALKAKLKTSGDSGGCQGIEALGVMKADVDNLGMLFGCGLPEERFTVSRLATMSRQMNSYFALYLPHLLASTARFFDVYTVFAGGDDLFLIGPWNTMAELALLLRGRFGDFACNNPEITFSCGITVHKPNTPVDAMAETSEDALNQAKRSGRNCITMFGKTVTWDDFRVLLDMRNDMERWLTRNYISDAMFYRFNFIVGMAEKEGRLWGKERISLEDLDCVKWPALFKYSLARNVTGRKEVRDQALEDVGRASGWIKTHRGAMRIPLWHVMYEKRR